LSRNTEIFYHKMHYRWDAQVQTTPKCNHRLTKFT